VRVPEEVENLEHILLFESLKGNAAGRETFSVMYCITFFSAQKIKWQRYEFVHTDDAAEIGRQALLHGRNKTGRLLSVTVGKLWLQANCMKHSPRQSKQPILQKPQGGTLD
jgi:hypothetical protein